MSLTKDLLNEVRRINAQHSTGPRTKAGKQRTKMNARQVLEKLREAGMDSMPGGGAETSCVSSGGG